MTPERSRLNKHPFTVVGIKPPDFQAGECGYERDAVQHISGVSSRGALGGVFQLRDGTRLQVVGVVEDGKYMNLTEERRRRCISSSCRRR